MAKIISAVQQKGGVGKTSITVHLAFELAHRFPHLRVAVADADQQQSATQWIERGSQEIVRAYTVAEDRDGVNLKEELAAIEADIILLDLPPGMGAITFRAALRSNLMIIPVGPSVLDITAAKKAVNTCKEILEVDDSKNYLLIPSKVQKNTTAGKQLRLALKAWGNFSYTAIGQRRAFADAAAVGEGITTYAPKSVARAEISNLVTEILPLIDLDEEKDAPIYIDAQDSSSHLIQTTQTL